MASMLANLKQHGMASVPVNLNTLRQACLSNLTAGMPINLKTTHCGKRSGQSKMAINLAKSLKSMSLQLCVTF